MRVLLLGPYPPPHGGVQTNLVAIRQFLADRGISCSVINLTRHRKADSGGVFYPKSALELIRLVLRVPSDLLHLHIGGDVSLRLLSLSLFCCLVPGKKAVLTFHSGGYPSSPAGRTARPFTLRGFVFRRFDRIIGVNAEILEMFARFGIPKRKLRLILPHSVSPPPDTPLPSLLSTFFEQHDPVLLTVGLLEPEYDLHAQIDVMGSVRERFPRAGLAIIGSGSLELQLRAAIAGKSYGDHVLLAGDVPHSSTLQAIAESDVFLRTTLYDGDSVSVREALHIGTAVIATDNGMRPPGVVLVPVSSQPYLLQAIAQCLTETPNRQPITGERDDSNIQAVYNVYRELS